MYFYFAVDLHFVVSFFVKQITLQNHNVKIMILHCNKPLIFAIIRRNSTELDMRQNIEINNKLNYIF